MPRLVGGVIHAESIVPDDFSKRLVARNTLRLIKKYKSEGLKGLVHKSRGRISNHKMPLEQEAKVIKIVREKYYDFGPTFASEKLEEEENKIYKE